MSDTTSPGLDDEGGDGYESLGATVTPLTGWLLAYLCFDELLVNVVLLQVARPSRKDTVVGLVDCGRLARGPGCRHRTQVVDPVRARKECIVNEWIIGVALYIGLIVALSRIYRLSWKQALVVGLLPVGWPVALVWFGIRRHASSSEAPSGEPSAPTSSGV